MDFTSKNDENVTLNISSNDNNEVVFCIRSEHYPHSQYFVLKNQDIPQLFEKVKTIYVDFADYLGSLGE